MTKILKLPVIGMHSMSGYKNKRSAYKIYNKIWVSLACISGRNWKDLVDVNVNVNIVSIVYAIKLLFYM